MKRIITIIAAIMAAALLASCAGENLRPDQIGTTLLQREGVAMPDGRKVTLTLEKYRGYWSVSVSGEAYKVERYWRDGTRHLELLEDAFTITENATGEILVDYGNRTIYTWR